MIKRAFVIAVVLGCGSHHSTGPGDAGGDAAIGPIPFGCPGVVARVSAGLTPFGPTYGATPPPATPPVAFLAPGDCLAVRVDSAQNGAALRLQLDGDEASGWTAAVNVDGIDLGVALSSIGSGVVEAALITPPNAKQIRVSAIRPDCANTRTATLHVFANGDVAVVGYSTADCSGGPRSLRKYKTDIAYVDDDELARLHDSVMQLHLARYRYFEDPQGVQRLGVMLDDVEPGSPVTTDRRTVDLYSYASLAIAIAQQQERELAELRARVEALEQAHSHGVRR